MPLVRKLYRTLVACLTALGLVLVVVTFTPIVPWYARALSGNWDDPRGDILIVLGGGTIDDTTLAAGSYWRSIYADRTWRSGHFREVIVSGKGVAPLMRDFLICHSLPASVIRVEDASHSTRENALFTKKLLAGAPGRPVLVTSDYHMFRARRVFAKAGIAVRTCPFPDVIKSSNNLTGRWGGFIILVQETAKIAYYWVRGWM